MNFFETWYAVLFFLILGGYLIINQIFNKKDSSFTKFNGYRAGILSLIYSIALTIAKIMGKV
jgi:hypothetical protein